MFLSNKQFLSVADYERGARRRLPNCVSGYVAGGTEDEVSLRANRRIFDTYGFLPRGLCDVAKRQTSIELWGQTFSMPVGIAPTGLAAMVAHDGDLMLATAAKAAGVPFIISGASNVPLEEIQKHAPGCWYQAYFPGDIARIGRIADRISAAGIQTLVVTMDTAVGANRENNTRANFSTPFRMTPSLVVDGILHPVWSVDVFLRGLLKRGVPRFANFHEEIGAPITQEPADGFRTNRDRLTWDHIRWLRDNWPGRLVIKGLLHPDDARISVSVGVDAVIVSNHGGRQLDGAISTLQALPAIVAEVTGKFPIFVDGGIRRGTDVLKALALGAKMVFVGRPVLYGAAVGGRRGVDHVLSILKEEIGRDLALLGLSNPSEISSSVLQRHESGVVGAG